MIRIAVLVLLLCNIVPADEIDPNGKPPQELVKVKSARYFVWYDSNGWHLRTASKNYRTFDGAIKLIDGTFGKMRTVGIDKHDKWEINADRTEMQFKLNTGGSFDGFDFDIRGKEVKLEFDLKTLGGQSRPGAIFIGRDQKHPEKAQFTLQGQD